MHVTLQPRLLSGDITAPASKSDAHRCLILAALSDTRTQLTISESSNDIDTTIDCLRALGAQIEWSNTQVTITPGPFAEGAMLHAGESGSTLRFLLPVAAAVCETSRFDGSARLPERPINALLDCMADRGTAASADKIPLTLAGKLTPGTYTLPGHISSQYISGLLMALPMLPGDSEIHLSSPLESSGYVDMTLDTMRRFSVTAERTAYGFFVQGNQQYRAQESLCVEGDWSGAAFYLAAGAIGRPITMRGLRANSLQRDRHILDYLRAFGASVTESGDAITIAPGTLRGTTIDVTDVPDLLPILSVVAAVAEGETKLTGAARLRLKESDRLESTADMLRNLSGSVTVQADSLIIQGKPHLSGGTVESCDDHRITMSAAIASIRAQEPVTIRDAHAHKKSYARFFEEFARLGGDVHVIDNG